MNRWILIVLIILLCVLCPPIGIPVFAIYLVVDFIQTVIKWSKKIFGFSRSVVRWGKEIFEK